MPELYWRYGYLFALGLMAIVAGILLVYFRRRRWI
jgi:magnesium transporter